MVEQDIIQNILDGKTNDFQLIIKKYERLVFHILNGMINNKNDQEELYQEIFFKVYKNLNKFRFDSKFSTWIGKIAYNTILNFLKKKKNYKEKFITEELNENMELNDFNYLIEKEVETKNLSEILKRMINNLPDKYKTIITLFHFEDFSYIEISEIMKMPEGTVKNYLFRARQLLKEKISLSYSLEEL